MQVKAKTANATWMLELIYSLKSFDNKFTKAKVEFLSKILLLKS